MTDEQSQKHDDLDEWDLDDPSVSVQILDSHIRICMESQSSDPSEHPSAEMMYDATTMAFLSMKNIRNHLRQPEPKAWAWEHMGSHVTTDKERAERLMKDGVEVTPLYAALAVPER